MAVCFTGPPLRRWRYSSPGGANYVPPAHISGPLLFCCPLFMSLFCGRRGPIAIHDVVAATPRHLLEAAGPANDRAQLLGGTCWPGGADSPDLSLQGDPICTGYCGISPRVAVFEGIGQVMQRRRESRRQHRLPAPIRPAARRVGGLGRCSSVLLERFEKIATSRGDLRQSRPSPSTICPHQALPVFCRLHSMADCQSLSSSYLSRDAVALHSCTQHSRYCSHPFPPLP